MTTQIFDRAAASLRLLVGATLLLTFFFYVAYSIHWTIIWDSAVMHYVNFLMDHGMRPYRDISDSNMPGAYLTERWAMNLFGKGDLGWRMYDFTLSILLALSFIVIARPFDWMAGAYAGGLFALLHGSEGPDFAVEREQVMTTLLAVAITALFVAIRRRQPAFMALFGLAMGIAASIKPTCGPLALAVGIAALVVLHRRGQRLLAFVLSALAGFSVAVATVVWFFASTHSFHDFLFVTKTLLPSYVGTRHLPFHDLLRILLPKNILLLLPIGAVLALRNRFWNYERWMLLAATLFGAVSFFAQRKGIIYHRYPFVAFLLLLLGLEFLPALRTRGLQRSLGALGLLVTLIVSVPHYLVEMHHTTPVSALRFTRSLTDDLAALGSDRLDHKVECFDLTDGCFSALYHLGLVQNNGFTGDLLFFSPDPSPVADFYRQQFWHRARVDPPEIFVLSNEWFQVGHTFRKLEAWPEFHRYLNANYLQVISRAFPVPGASYDTDQPSRYRIYIRKGSPLLEHTAFAPTSAEDADRNFKDPALPKL